MSANSGIPDLALEGVASWRGAATHAYSIIHDDIGRPEADGFFEHGVPELEARGLTVGLAVIVGDCERRGLWDRLQWLVDTGHEIINHGWSHIDQVEQPCYAAEIDRARRVLDAKLRRHKTSFFCFPYDRYDDSAVAHLRVMGYLGARAGGAGVNPADDDDDLRVRWDTFGPAWSSYEGDVLTAHLDAARTSGGWAVRELHGVEDRSWESIARADYRAHLDALCERIAARQCWVAPPSAVLRYRRLRAHVGMPRFDGRVVRFAALPVAAQRLRTELTLVFSAAVPAAYLEVGQRGRALELVPLGGGRFTVDADPFAGPLEVRARATDLHDAGATRWNAESA